MSSDSREILVPHDTTRGPLKAVRRMLVQSSLAELKGLGVYDRYCGLIDATSLEAITDQIGPGWLPVDLAMAHYRTCDALGLSDAQLEQLGALAGEKLARTLLVGGKTTSEAEPSPWSLVGAFSRMGRRIYEGSSSQYVKIGRKQLQIENIGNPLLSIHYYRTAHLAFLRSAFSSLGVQVATAKLTSFRREGAMAEVRLVWT